MSILDDLLSPQPLRYYEDQVAAKNEVSITLNKQEAAVALKAYDRGIDALNADEKHLVNCIIASIKHELWP